MSARAGSKRRGASSAPAVLSDPLPFTDPPQYQHSTPAVVRDARGCQSRVCWCHDDTAVQQAGASCGGCGCRWVNEPADDTSPRTKHLQHAETLLRHALMAAKKGQAPRTADAIRHAIKSAGGAIRHADHDAARARRKGGK